MEKKQKEPCRKCADCIHEWACQAWTHGTIHEMNADHCAMYQTARGSNAYFLGYLEAKKKYEKAICKLQQYEDLGYTPEELRLCFNPPKEKDSDR